MSIYYKVFKAEKFIKSFDSRSDADAYALDVSKKCMCDVYVDRISEAVATVAVYSRGELTVN